MQIDRRSSSLLIAVFVVLAIAVPALAATGGDSPPSNATTTAPAKGDANGGTPTKPAPDVQPSGGVAGPAAEDRARSAQDPPEESPQVEPPTEYETTPTETTPETTPEHTAPEEDAEQAPGEEAGQAPSSGSGSGGGGGGGGLPSTGLEVGGLVAAGLCLLLAGVALRRRPRSG